MSQISCPLTKYREDKVSWAATTFAKDLNHANSVFDFKSAETTV